MHITFNTQQLTSDDVRVLTAIAAALQTSSPAAVSPQPQPEVGDNTGTSSTGITLSPGAAGVGEPGGSDAPGSAPDTTPKARNRKPKETAAVPVGEPASAAPAAEAGASSATAATETSANAATPAADPAAKPITLDDVRAKLQAFTGAKGIDAGLALLGEFKAGRISELKAEDYRAFIAKCEVA